MMSIKCCSLQRYFQEVSEVVTHQIIREVWAKIGEIVFHWQPGKTETEEYCCCEDYASLNLGRRMIQRSAVDDVDDHPGPKKWMILTTPVVYYHFRDIGNKAQARHAYFYCLGVVRGAIATGGRDVVSKV
jgi:hypothetical protein